MSAESAYRAAQAAIVEAKAEGASWLDFSGKEFHDLESLPPEIAGLTEVMQLFLDNSKVSDITSLGDMTELGALFLSNTQVSDITPLQDMVTLIALWLDNTRVSDITPLRRMTAMTHLMLNDTLVSDIAPLQDMTSITDLRLNNTQVSDIAPLRGLAHLSVLYLNGSMVSDLRPVGALDYIGDTSSDIQFSGIPALALDPNLVKIARIENNYERSFALLQYLDEIGDNWPPLSDTKDAPEQQAAPRVRVLGGVVDVDPATPTPEELDDQVKRQALARLRSAVDRLATAANRYPDLDLPARNLRGHLQGELAGMDLLEVHFELEELQGIFSRRSERQAEDRFDPDILGALDRVCMVGPGLTMDNAAVEAFEARRARYLDRPSALRAIPENRELSQAIIEDPQLYGEAIRAYSELFLRAENIDTPARRLSAGQSFLNRNTVLTVGLIFASNALSGPLGTVGTQAMQWLAANAHAISALAPGWGEAFQVWIAPILMRANEASAAAAAMGQNRRP
jgi:hypothetical protein